MKFSWCNSQSHRKAMKNVFFLLMFTFNFLKSRFWGFSSFKKLSSEVHRDVPLSCLLLLVGLAVLRLPPTWLPITPPSSHQHGSFTHQRTLSSLTKKWQGWDGKTPQMVLTTSSPTNTRPDQEYWCNLYFSRQLDMTWLVSWNHA